MHSPSSVLLNLWPQYCIGVGILFNYMDNEVRTEKDVAGPDSPGCEKMIFILCTPDSEV